MEEKQLGVSRKRESDDNTGEASPKKARIEHEHQGTSPSPSADDVKNDLQDPSKSPDEAKSGRQGSSEALVPNKTTSDHQDATDTPKPDGASTDHEGPGEIPTPDEALSDRQGASEVSVPNKIRSDHQDAIDRPRPDGASTDHEGPGEIPTPDEALSDRQGASESPDTNEARRLVEEGHFITLYTKIVDNIKERESLRDENIEEGCETARDAFMFAEGHRFSDINFNLPQNVCGYLLRAGGATAAGLARYRVLQAARNCPDLMEMCRGGKGRLRVVSVGGGPAADALGFCSALMELGFSEGCDLDITVLDKIPQWEECVKVDQDPEHPRTRTITVDHLLRQKKENFGQASVLFQRNRVTLNYVTGELPVKETQVGYTAMKNADVILVQRVLSSLPRNKIPGVVENIQSTMNNHAFFLLINTTLDKSEEGKLLYKCGDDSKRCFENFDLNFLSEKEDTYYLFVRNSRKGCNNFSKAQIAVLRKKKTKQTRLSLDRAEMSNI